MSRSAKAQTITTACPSCKARFSAKPALVGRAVDCPKCRKRFVVQPVRVGARGSTLPAARRARPRSAGRPTARAADRRCPICQTGLRADEPAAQCPECKTAFHADCWKYNGGCGMYGCAQAPQPEGLRGIEIPASHWGQEYKQCPQCRQTILAAALRCRSCGATFETAVPQSAAAYYQTQVIQGKLPALRTASIALLVLSLIPCTAPAAAVVGVVWYLSNRQLIRCLPALNAALCKIAVGVAVVQTGLIFLFGVLNSLANFR